jgi:uncharacterized SAM-binding protein YcdF (DUF218 family)
MKRDIVLRTAVILLCLLGVAYFLSPMAGGQVLHIGMWLPSAALLLPASAALFPAAVKALFIGRLRVLGRIAAGFAAAGLLAFAALFIWMGAAASNSPAEGLDVTVIVLGCRVDGDNPTGMLTARIETAYRYLAAHPDAFCIATGGLGSGANFTEAQVIRDMLIQMGIDGDRILMEERSHNTYENFLLSSAIIEAYSLPRDVVVVSDNFHQLRASLFAKQHGLTPYAYGAVSSWRVGPAYSIRESLAVVRALILGR